MKTYHVTYTYSENRVARGAVAIDKKTVRFRPLSKRFHASALKALKKIYQYKTEYYGGIDPAPTEQINISIYRGMSGAMDIVFRIVEDNPFADYPIIAKIHISASGYVEEFSIPSFLVPALLGALRQEKWKLNIDKVHVLSPQLEANYQQFMRRLCDMWSQDNIQVVHQTEGNLWTECPEKCSSLPIVDFDDWNGEKNVIVRAKIEQCDEYFAGEYPAGFLVLKEEEEEEEEEEVLE